MGLTLALRGLSMKGSQQFKVKTIKRKTDVVVLLFMLLGCMLL